MQYSEILDQVITIEKCEKNRSTHFILCNQNKIRYIICLDEGAKRLYKNISTYSLKLKILMIILSFVPLSILSLFRMGYFARVELNEIIDREIKNIDRNLWNVIVGTYDEKQKIVFQCFEKNVKECMFVKVGNYKTKHEMKAEMDFLNSSPLYNKFEIPKLVSYRYIDIDNPFSIQVTKEFFGKKVRPIINEDIIMIYKEISLEKK